MKGYEGKIAPTDDEYYVSEEWKSLSAKLSLGEARRPVFGPLILDARSGLVRASDTGESAKLSPTEFQILWLLVRAEGKPVTQAQIGEFLYRDRHEADLPNLGNNLAVLVFHLKKKLEKITQSVYIPDQSREGKLGFAQYEISFR